MARPFIDNHGSIFLAIRRSLSATRGIPSVQGRGSQGVDPRGHPAAPVYRRKSDTVVTANHVNRWKVRCTFRCLVHADYANSFFADCVPSIFPAASCAAALSATSIIGSVSKRAGREVISVPVKVAKLAGSQLGWGLPIPRTRDRHAPQWRPR